MRTAFEIASPGAGELKPRRWVWLLPFSYAAHVVEEAFGGDGIAGWIIAQGGVRFSIAGFLGINLLALAIIVGATWAARKFPAWRWTLVSGGTILLVNGLCHIVVSAAMRSYVSGLWTGLVLYAPLGGVLLFYLRRIVSARIFWAAAAAGFMIHAAVLWIVFGMPGLPAR